MTILISVAVLFAIALVPVVISLFLIHKAESRAREQLRTAMNTSVTRRLGRFYGYPLPPITDMWKGLAICLETLLVGIMLDRPISVVQSIPVVLVRTVLVMSLLSLKVVS